jgi:hypothetical protein
MNILEITESLKDLSDQELAGAGAPEYLKQQEISRRLDVRNRYQAQQAQVDATKTVAEKNLEQLMMGGIAGADPMMGQEGDPSMQAGIAGGMEAPPPQGPPMMYGGGMLGFHEGGGLEDHEHPHSDEDNRSRRDRRTIPIATTSDLDPYDPDSLLGIFKQAPKDLSGVDSYLTSMRSGGRNILGIPSDKPRLGHTNLPDIEEWLDAGRTLDEYEELNRRIEEDTDIQAARDRYQAAQETDAGTLDIYRTTASGLGGQGIRSIADLARDDPMFVGARAPSLSTRQRVQRLLATYPSVRNALETIGFDNLDFNRMDYQKIRDLIPEEEIEARRAIESAAIEEETGSDEPETAEERLQNQIDGDSISQDAANLSASNRLSGRGLGSTEDVFNEMKSIYGDLRDMRLDPKTYAKSDAMTTSAANAAFQRQKGLRGLAQSRVEEQEALLARELGLSRERVSELRSEMETPESIEQRRRASLFSALGATLMGSPRELGSGLERTTDKLLALDEKIATERETDLTGIFDERKRGMERERAGRGQIYTTTSQAETAFATANDAFDKALRDQQKAVEDRDVAAETTYADQMGNALAAQANVVAQFETTDAALRNELAKIQIQGTNHFLEPDNWRNIQIQINSMRQQADSLKKTEGKPEVVRAAQAKARSLERLANNIESAFNMAVQQAGDVSVIGQQTSTGSAGIRGVPTGQAGDGRIRSLDDEG